jgi:hypothetical protein
MHPEPSDDAAFEHTSASDCHGSRRDLVGCADHEASRSECPCVLHRVHRSEGNFGLAAVLLQFLTANDVVGAVDPDQMPVSGDSLNQLALNCCVQALARIESFVEQTSESVLPAKNG